MCTQVSECFSSLWAKLPALETKEQTEKHLFSTTRKVLSCVPYLGFFMGLTNYLHIANTYWDYEHNRSAANSDIPIRQKMLTIIRCYFTSTLITLICAVALKIFSIGLVTGLYLATGAIALGAGLSAIGIKKFLNPKLGA